MRVYILREEQKQAIVNNVMHQRTQKVYYLLDNIECFVKRYLDAKWAIEADFTPDVSGHRSVILAEGLDDGVATQTMEQLLRFTSGSGEGTAIISWSGTRFSQRML
jgi:hypothetical protein